MTRDKTPSSHKRPLLAPLLPPVLPSLVVVKGMTVADVFALQEAAYSGYLQQRDVYAKRILEDRAWNNEHTRGAGPPRPLDVHRFPVYKQEGVPVPEGYYLPGNEPPSVLAVAARRRAARRRQRHARAERRKARRTGEAIAALKQKTSLREAQLSYASVAARTTRAERENSKKKDAPRVAVNNANNAAARRKVKRAVAERLPPPAPTPAPATPVAARLLSTQAPAVSTPVSAAVTSTADSRRIAVLRGYVAAGTATPRHRGELSALEARSPLPPSIPSSSRSAGGRG